MGHRLEGKKRSTRMETKLIHSGEPEPRIEGAVVMPIFQSSTYESRGEKSYRDIRYIRLNNTPNHRALHRKLAAIEGAEDALVTASGMAAISTTLLTVLTSGDHLLANNTLYGGTLDFIVKDFPGLNLSFDWIDGTDPTGWEKKLKPNTKAVYMESITNPLIQVPDLKAVVAFAEKNGLVSIIDNTFATPINFRPPEWGFDLSLHSGTKYLNGHSDIVCGAIIGKAAWIERVFDKLMHLGGSLDPHACFLLHRGLKTLSVRVRYQNESALKLAKFLNDHPLVERVNYAGLETSPDYGRAKDLFDGYGGMLSFEVRGGLPASRQLLNNLTIPIVAPSLGGVETLVTLPAATSHSEMDPEERRLQGIADGLVRVSVGLEATEDLISDFSDALNGLG
ncbi:MAG: PLP-dependent aspartate aminotransferase family protein [Candidatus Aminicenantes bacterium]|nr:PLP-dependent aspartate aminotransferase family protein [Candidatus Aminicenantes bacterium]